MADSTMRPCVCGHRRAVAHPNGGRCWQRVVTDSATGEGKPCKCKRFREAVEAK